MSSSSAFARRLATACVLLLAAACAPAPGGGDGGADAGRPAADAGVDAGDPFVYPDGPQAIGGPCRADGDCNSGHCDLQTAHGYCIDSCQTNTDCPVGSACEQVGRGQGYCVQLCSADGDCQAGTTTCKAIYVECLPAPGCTSNTDCPHDRACNVSSGLCTGVIGGQVDIGGACHSSTDCGEGERPYCLDDTDGFPGGYCSSFCKHDGDCGTGNVCIGGLVSGNADLALCFHACAADGDCRDGYVCAASEPEPFCVPACHADSDCVRDGSICDLATGHCSGPAVTDADGGTDAPDGGDVDAGTDGSDVDGGALEGGDTWTTLPRMPQAVYQDGPVLETPLFVPVFFKNDAPADVTYLEQFDAQIGASDYWAATTSEYGVGPGSATDPVVLDETMTGSIDDRDIQSWLAKDVAQGKLPAPDDNTLYVLHYPASVSISLQGELSCGSFGAYHSEARLTDGTRVAYAVVPRCQYGDNALDTETGSESHEMIEAATDPKPFSAPAWATIDDAHAYWPYAIGGGELADLCEQQPGVMQKQPDLAYVVQRSWSNAAVAAGRSPCQPELPGAVYFGAVPELSDLVPYSLGGGQAVTTLGVKVPPGTTRTIGLDLYAEGDGVPAWSVAVQSASFGGPGPFTYTLDRTSGVAGDRLALTITASPDADRQGSDIFYVVSSGDAGATYWLGLASP